MTGSMTGRRLQATLLPAGPALLDAVSRAMDGSGPAVLPLDPDAPRAVIAATVRALRPHAILDDDGVSTVDGRVAVADDVALVVATSGSTGKPKGVELTAAALRSSAEATLERIGTDQNDRWLCCLPTSHIAGLQVLTRSVIAGHPPVLHHRFDLDAFATAPATVVSLVPTMLRRLLDARVDLTRWKTILLGGAAAPAPLLHRAAEAGARVVTTYGMSETSGGCVYDGRPLRGVGVDIGADGRIAISGPTLARGYRLDDSSTSASFVDGRLITGDLGRIDRDGALQVLGRADDAIVTGGVTVAPAETSAAVADHPDVAEVAVVGVPDAEWGERVVALVVPADRAPTLASLRAHALARVRREAAPRALVIVDALPLLASGKPDRAALRRLAAASD